MFKNGEKMTVPEFSKRMVLIAQFYEIEELYANKITALL
jgi:hypothetical protein